MDVSEVDQIKSSELPNVSISGDPAVVKQSAGENVDCIKSPVPPHLLTTGESVAVKQSAGSSDANRMASGQPAATGQTVATCGLPQLVPAAEQGTHERRPGEDEEHLSREELLMRALDRQLEGLGGGGRRRRRAGGKAERQKRREAQKMRQIWFEAKALFLKNQLLQSQGISAGTVVDRRMILSSFRLLDIEQKYVIPRERFFSALETDLDMQWGHIETARFWRMLCGGNRAKLSFQAFSLVFKADPRNVAANQRLFIELGLKLTQKQAPRPTISGATRFDGNADDARGVNGQSPSIGQGGGYTFGKKSNRGSCQGGADFMGQGGLDEGPAYSMGKASRIRPTPPKLPKSNASRGRPTPAIVEDEDTGSEEEEEEEEEEKEELSPEDALRLRAATRLQACWRGHWCREQLWRKRAEPYAIKLQAAFRSRIARRFADVLKLVTSYQKKVARSSQSPNRAARRKMSKRRSTARLEHAPEPISRSLSKRRSTHDLEPADPSQLTARSLSKRRSSARTGLDLEPVAPVSPSPYSARSSSKRRSSARMDLDPEPPAPLTARESSKRRSSAGG